MKSDTRSVVLIDEQWNSQGPGRVTTMAPAPGATEPRLVACRKGFDEVMEHVGEDRFRLRLDGKDVYFRATPNVTLDPKESPEGVALRLTVPGAGEADIRRGLQAVERHFEESGVSPYTAAYALFYLEGEYDLPAEAVDWANVWLAAQGIAVAACCEGWSSVPSEDCDLSLTGLGGPEPAGAA